jgi:hypothetical protein
MTRRLTGFSHGWRMNSAYSASSSTSFEDGLVKVSWQEMGSARDVQSPSFGFITQSITLTAPLRTGGVSVSDSFELDSRSLADCDSRGAASFYRMALELVYLYRGW